MCKPRYVTSPTYGASNPQVSAKDNIKTRATIKTRKPAEPKKEAPKKAVVTKKEVPIPVPKPRVTKKTVTEVKDVTTSQVIKETRSRVECVPKEDTEMVEEEPITKKVKTQDWDDLDADDGYDPCMVAEYVVEIFEYMKKLEVRLFL